MVYRVLMFNRLMHSMCWSMVWLIMMYRQWTTFKNWFVMCYNIVVSVLNYSVIYSCMVFMCINMN